MFAAGAVCALMIIGCGPKPPSEDAPSEPPAPPAELTNNTGAPEVSSQDQILFVAEGNSSPSEIYRMNPNGSGLTRLTNNLEKDWQPAWAPDGKRYFYICGGSICSAAPNGGNVEVVYSSGEKLYSPTLSPDGSTLAFTENIDYFDDLMLLDVQSGEVTNVTNSPEVYDQYPAWDPQGGLAWSTAGKIMHLENEAVTVLFESAELRAIDPDFTPDGATVVFSATTAAAPNGDTNLYSFDRVGGGVKQLTSTSLNESSPSVSPDGSKIAYLQSTSLDSEIHTINVNGTGAQRITDVPGRAFQPNWGEPAVTISMGEDVTAAEGNPPATTTPFRFEVELSQAATATISVKYAVTGISASVPDDVAAASGSVTFSAGVKTQSISVPVVVDDVPETAESFKVTLSEPVGAILGDATARGVIEDDDFVASPSPSPVPSSSPTVAPGLSKSGQIAWTSDENGDYDIWVKGLDGSNLRHVTSSSDTEASPDFSPDGEVIVFHGGPGAPDIYWVPSDGHAPPTKIQGSASSADVTPTWSPDGSEIAWVSSGGSVNIVRATPPNGSPSLLADSLNDEAYPDWHTLYNGHEGLVYQEQTGEDDFQLVLFDRDSGSFTELGEGRNPEISPDGRKVAFASIADGDLDIYSLDLSVTGAKRVQLTNAPGHDSVPVWSPDGSSIAFTSHRDGNAEIYIMTADGKQQTNFTNRPSDDFEPTWGVDPKSSTRSVEPVRPNHDREGDDRLRVGIALPTMLGAAWMLRLRRQK